METCLQVITRMMHDVKIPALSQFVDGRSCCLRIKHVEGAASEPHYFFRALKHAAKAGTARGARQPAKEHEAWVDGRSV